MAISAERLKELMAKMMSTQDENGWCYLPENLTKEEGQALYKCLTISTMRDRIELILNDMNKTFKFIVNIKKGHDNEDEFDIMDNIKYKAVLNRIKTDAQNMLMDLHSPDKISDFFHIDLVTDNTNEGENNMKAARKEMEILIRTKFKKDIDTIKGHCTNLVEYSDKALELLNG